MKRLAKLIINSSLISVPTVVMPTLRVDVTQKSAPVETVTLEQKSLEIDAKAMFLPLGL